MFDVPGSRSSFWTTQKMNRASLQGRTLAQTLFPGKRNLACGAAPSPRPWTIRVVLRTRGRQSTVPGGVWYGAPREVRDQRRKRSRRESSDAIRRRTKDSGPSRPAQPPRVLSNEFPASLERHSVRERKAYPDGIRSHQDLRLRFLGGALGRRAASAHPQRTHAARDRTLLRR